MLSDGRMYPLTFVSQSVWVLDWKLTLWLELAVLLSACCSIPGSMVTPQPIGQSFGRFGPLTPSRQ